MTDTATLIWSLVFGAFGLGYFIYGRRQRAVVPLVTGIALMIFPYVTANIYLLVIVGVALTAVPYFVRL